MNRTLTGPEGFAQEMLDKAAAEGPLKVTRGDLYAWSKGIESLQAEVEEANRRLVVISKEHDYEAMRANKAEAEAEGFVLRNRQLSDEVERLRKELENSCVCEVSGGLALCPVHPIHGIGGNP